MLGKPPISNAVFFSKFTVNINRHHHSPVLEHFHHSRKLPPFSVFHPSPTTGPLPACVNLSFWDMKHIIFCHQLLSF